MNIHNLLKESASSNEITQLIITTITDINKLDLDGNTYLHIAISHQHTLDTIYKIIKLGCDYNSKNKNGLNSFELYFEYGNVQILDQIIMLMLELNIEFTNIMFSNYINYCSKTQLETNNNICKLIIEKINDKFNPIIIFDNILSIKLSCEATSMQLPNQKILFDVIKMFDELVYDKSIIFQQILQKYSFDTYHNIIDYFIFHNASINYYTIKQLLCNCDIDNLLQTNFILKILKINCKLTHNEIASCILAIRGISSKLNNYDLLEYWNNAEYIKYLFCFAIMDNNDNFFDDNEKAMRFLNDVIKNLDDENNFCSGYFIIVSFSKFLKFIISNKKSRSHTSFLLLKAQIESLESAKNNRKLKEENEYYKIHIENSPDSDLVKNYLEHFNSMIDK